MPSLAAPESSTIAGGRELKDRIVVISKIPGEVRSPIDGDCTPHKRRLRSDTARKDATISAFSPSKKKSPRRCINGSPKSSKRDVGKDSGENPLVSQKLLANRISDVMTTTSNWNPRDSEQIRAVKDALHVSKAPPVVVCREEEQRMVLQFVKECVGRVKAGSLYICGCPGTGKSLLMEKVKKDIVQCAIETGFQPPDVLAINCTSLAKSSEIFTKILETLQPKKKLNGSITPLQQLQNFFSQKQPHGTKMLLIIADELDYLINRDCAVLHDLFMLTLLPFSRCILIGVANAIDLADRFLPRLQSLNCKPMVVTFRSYSKDQIFRILNQRMTALPYTVFQPQALELCARKVAAASGDMRKALCICRCAIEILEADLRESACDMSFSSAEDCSFEQQATQDPVFLTKNELDVVRVDHMAIALSKTYRSPTVDIIQSLPQHQQIILCAAVKHFDGGKKDTTLGELNKSYIDICKSALIPPINIMEVSSMCRVLSDQGLLKLGQSRDDKLRRISLKVDEGDISFALQGVRFFRSCLQ